MASQATDAVTAAAAMAQATRRPSDDGRRCPPELLPLMNITPQRLASRRSVHQAIAVLSHAIAVLSAGHAAPAENPDPNPGPENCCWKTASSAWMRPRPAREPRPGGSGLAAHHA